MSIVLTRYATAPPTRLL